MPRLDTVWVVLLAIPVVAFASPDAARNSRETRVDHRQLVVDRAWNERDARELAEFEQLSRALRDANRDRMTGRYREINEKVQAAMTREIGQAQVRSAQAMFDARLSRRQWDNERMQASVSGDAGSLFEPGADAGDLRHETRESEAALARYQEMARIGTLATALQNPIERGDRAAMKRNAELAENFLAMMRRDLAASSIELRDDRAEVR